MLESIAFLTGGVLAAGVVIVSVALILNKFINFYLGIFFFFFLLLILRGAIGGFGNISISIADFIAIGLLVLIYWLRQRSIKAKS